MWDHLYIECITIHSDLLEKLEQLDKEYEYILIDVAGRDSTIFREALLVSDTLIGLCCINM